MENVKNRKFGNFKPTKKLSPSQKTINNCEPFNMDKLNEYFPVKQKRSKNHLKNLKSTRNQTSPSVDKENIKTILNKDAKLGVSKTEIANKSEIKIMTSASQSVPNPCLLQIPTVLLQTMLKSSNLASQLTTNGLGDNSKLSSKSNAQSQTQKRNSLVHHHQQQQYNHSQQQPQQQQQPQFIMNQQQQKLHQLFQLFQAQKLQSQQQAAFQAKPPLQQSQEHQKMQNIPQKEQMTRQLQQALSELQQEQLQRVQEQRQRRKVSIESPVIRKRKNSEKFRLGAKIKQRAASINAKKFGNLSKFLDVSEDSNEENLNELSSEEAETVNSKTLKPINLDNVRFNKVSKKSLRTTNMTFEKIPCMFEKGPAPVPSKPPIKKNTFQNHVDSSDEFSDNDTDMKTKRTLIRFVKTKPKVEEHENQVQKRAEISKINTQTESTFENIGQFLHKNPAKKTHDFTEKKSIENSFETTTCGVKLENMTNCEAEVDENDDDNDEDDEENDGDSDDICDEKDKEIKNEGRNKEEEDFKQEDKDENNTKELNIKDFVNSRHIELMPDSKSTARSENFSEKQQCIIKNPSVQMSLSSMRSLKSNVPTTGSKSHDNQQSQHSEYEDESSDDETETGSESDDEEEDVQNQRENVSKTEKIEPSKQILNNSVKNTAFEKAQDKIDFSPRKTKQKEVTVLNEQRMNQKVKLNDASAQDGQNKQEEKQMKQKQPTLQQKIQNNKQPQPQSSQDKLPKKSVQMLNEPLHSQTRLLQTASSSGFQKHELLAERKNAKETSEKLLTKNTKNNEQSQSQHSVENLLPEKIQPSSKQARVSLSQHTNTKTRSVTPDSTYAKLESIASTFINFDQTFSSKKMGTELHEGDKYTESSESESECEIHLPEKIQVSPVKIRQSRSIQESDKTVSATTMNQSLGAVNKSVKSDYKLPKKKIIILRATSEDIEKESEVKIETKSHREESAHEVATKSCFKNFQDSHKPNFEQKVIEKSRCSKNNSIRDCNCSESKGDQKSLKSTTNATHSPRSTKSDIKIKDKIIYAIPAIRYAKAHRSVESLNNFPTNIRVIRSISPSKVILNNSATKKGFSNPSSINELRPINEYNVTEKDVLRKTFIDVDNINNFRSGVISRSKLNENDNSTLKKKRNALNHYKAIVMDDEEIRSDSKYLIEAKLAYLAQSKSPLKSSSASYLKYFNEEVNRNFFDDNLISARCPSYNINGDYNLIEGQSNFGYESPVSFKNKYSNSDDNSANKYFFNSINDKPMNERFDKNEYNALGKQSLTDLSAGLTRKFPNLSQNWQAPTFEFNRSKSLKELSLKNETNMYNLHPDDLFLYNQGTDHSKSFTNTTILNSQYEPTVSQNSLNNYSQSMVSQVQQPYQQNNSMSQIRSNHQHQLQYNQYQFNQGLQHNQFTIEPHIQLNPPQQHNQFNHQRQLYSQQQPQQLMQPRMEMFSPYDPQSSKDLSWKTNQSETYVKPLNVPNLKNEIGFLNKFNFNPRQMNSTKLAENRQNTKQLMNTIMNSNDIFSLLNNSTFKNTRKNYEGNNAGNAKWPTDGLTKCLSTHNNNTLDKFYPLARKFAPNKLLKECFENGEKITSFSIYKQKYNYNYPIKQAWYANK